MSLLTPRDPMGIYQVLFSFAEQNHCYIGDPGTRPLSQGFPLTTAIPGGPELPSSLSVDGVDRMYPKADGTPRLRQAIADDYNRAYGTRLDPDHVMLFAGGRPGLVALLWMLGSQYRVVVEETEYTPYFDILNHVGRPFDVVPSHPGNQFRPSLDDVCDAATSGSAAFLRSNPCNPTGVSLRDAALADLAGRTAADGSFAAIVDEAYEYFQDPAPQSVLAHVDDPDRHRLFVVGAATKGLQAPGARVGWVVGPKSEIRTLRNYSSYGMGGVSQLSQNYVSQLMAEERVAHARRAIPRFYGEQRQRYRQAMVDLGFEDFTGSGGFYCWMRLPGDLTAAEFNRRLYRHKAAILPGELCDMHRRGPDSPLAHFIRLSFGPRAPEDFEGDIEVLARGLAG